MAGELGPVIEKVTVRRQAWGTCSMQNAEQGVRDGAGGFAQGLGGRGGGESDARARSEPLLASLRFSRANRSAVPVAAGVRRCSGLLLGALGKRSSD